MAEHIELNDNTHVFRARTKKTFEQFKKDANSEVGKTWASFLVAHEWRDHVMHLTSPGWLYAWAHGTGRLEQDVVVMELHLDRWPATSPWVRDRMLHDVARMTDAVSAYSNLQEEEFESRRRLQEAAGSKLEACRSLENAATQALARWSILDDVARVLIAVTGTGSAFAAWSDGLQAGGLRASALAVSTTVAVLGTMQAVLKASDQIKHWSELQGHFVRLRNDLESFLNDMDIKPDFALTDFQQRLQTIERRFADGEVQWRTDVLTATAELFARLRSRLTRSSEVPTAGGSQEPLKQSSPGHRTLRQARPVPSFHRLSDALGRS